MTDIKAPIGSINSYTALTIPNELPKKYPRKKTIKANDNLLHGLIAQTLIVFKFSTIKI